MCRRSAHLPLSGIESVDGYINKSLVRRQTDGYLPSHTAVPLLLGRYSFPILLRVGG